MGNNVGCSCNRAQTDGDMHSTANSKISYRRSLQGSIKSQCNRKTNKDFKIITPILMKKRPSLQRRSFTHMKTEMRTELTMEDSDSILSQPSVSCMTDETGMHTTEACARVQIKPDVVPRLNFGFSNISLSADSDSD